MTWIIQKGEKRSTSI